MHIIGHHFTFSYFNYLKKIFFLTIFFIGFALAAIAQKEKADSLAVLLAGEKADTNKVNLLWQLAEALSIYKPDSALQVGQNALHLANNIGYAEGQSRSLGILANTFINLGNYPRALEFNLKKLKLDENRDNYRNLATALMNIGVVYLLQEQYRDALAYYFKSDSVINANKIEDLKYYVAQNLGDIYDRLNVPDSAFFYYTKALATPLKSNKDRFTGASKTGLAHVYFTQKNYAASQSYYLEAIGHLSMADDDELLCEATLGYAKLLTALNKNDSAVYYAEQSLTIAKKANFQSREMDAAEYLAGLYNNAGRYDKAYVYLSKVQQLNDSINSKSKIREVQSISINEQLRQAEIAEAKRLAKKERDKQLQLLLIGLFIPAFFLGTLLLSRGRIHRRVIAILGILSLLILFEFLTLLLHPFVAELTNHKPVLEILIFVALAAILIPGHHRLEHWLIERLTKNKDGISRFNFKRNRMTVKIKKDPEQEL